ncbi:MAG: hypothetical protein OTI34_06400 [Lewinella sp.]|nr:hypothetical protein [Lewinella sp.]
MKVEKKPKMTLNCLPLQNAVIAFYKNTVSGRLMELTCSIRTYLFAIGKRLVYRKNEKRHREVPSDFDAGIGLGTTWPFNADRSEGVAG